MHYYPSILKEAIILWMKIETIWMKNTLLVIYLLKDFNMINGTKYSCKGESKKSFKNR